jgi:hypothetical protein
LVCEGPSDEAFFRALIARRGLPEFCIRNPNDINLAGIDAIGRTVASLKAATGFYDVADIVIIVDSDDDPIANFNNVKGQIAALSDYTFITPDHPLVRSASTPAITIATIPWIDKTGNLEHFCYPVAAGANPALGVHTDQYLTNAGVPAWANHQKRAKASLSAFLAVAIEQSPGLSIGKALNNYPDTIPLDHVDFDDLSGFLNGYR